MVQSHMTDDEARCELCGELMPPGETMFKFHGYSGPCPKEPLPKPAPINWQERAERAEKAEAERDALRQDAARYRWLRDGEECDVIFGDPEYEDRYAHVESLLALDDLDAAIDAARAAIKEGK